MFDMVLHPIPCLLGYSQLKSVGMILSKVISRTGGRTHSKSTPSRSYLVIMLLMTLTNSVRFSFVATEELKYTEPVQPPTETMIAVFCKKKKKHDQPLERMGTIEDIHMGMSELDEFAKGSVVLIRNRSINNIRSWYDKGESNNIIFIPRDFLGCEVGSIPSSVPR